MIVLDTTIVNVALGVDAAQRPGRRRGRRAQPETQFRGAVATADGRHCSTGHGAEVWLAALRGGGDPNRATPASHILRRLLPGNPWVMLFRRQIEDLDLTAPELHRLLLKLQAERALAVETGVAEAALYMADIDEEIELCRELYVLFAVTELATLRAEISGPHTG
jgi:hypothetical protein